MWITLHMRVIIFQYAQQEFGLAMSDSLDDEPVVSRKVEEGTRFAR